MAATVCPRQAATTTLPDDITARTTEYMRGLVDKDSWYRWIVDQFADELGNEGAFNGMTWDDARVVATVIVQDLTGMGHPRSRLKRRSRNIIRRAMRYDNSGPWDDPRGVWRAVSIAAELARSRVFGLPTLPL
ncbi:Uncharacterised protein [Mycolicibacterium phlei]|jgi:hypothetical protein|nr:hypothetical protein [Mycolicibacterium phlei]AMO60046.1 hypothetical protein MPHLCCUG_01220 [Mycolicibacterium phlei]STZ16618.1 Uncharacterised protein [Mycolicibacterium phlei]VEG08168.1 Uncharacterised protein [Mycobacteroides chelonae]